MRNSTFVTAGVVAGIVWIMPFMDCAYAGGESQEAGLPSKPIEAAECANCSKPTEPVKDPRDMMKSSDCSGCSPFPGPIRDQAYSCRSSPRRDLPTAINPQHVVGVQNPVHCSSGSVAPAHRQFDGDRKSKTI